MEFTIECGACATPYSIATEQLGKAGAKITCPTCHTFFYMRPNNLSDNKTPIVEILAEQDGEFEENYPSPIPGEVTTETILDQAIHSLTQNPNKSDPEKDISQDSAFSAPNEKDFEVTPPSDFKTSEPHIEENEEAMDTSSALITKNTNIVAPDISDIPLQDKIKPMHLDNTQDDPFQATGNFYDPDTIITKDSLAAYPLDRPAGKFDQILLWFMTFLLMIVLLLFINFKGIIHIPGLEMLQEQNLFPTPYKNSEKQQNDALFDEQSSQNRPQFGFPEIDEEE